MLSRFMRIPTIEEIARGKISESGTLPHDMTPEERGVFQREILEAQIASETESANFMADRSVFDAVAYAHDTPEYESLAAKAREHAKANPYTKVFFLRVEFPMKGDGVRSEDEAYRKKIESVLANELEKAGVPFEVITGGVGARLGKCLCSLGIGG